MASAPDSSSSFSSAADRIRDLLISAESISHDIRREASEEAERYLAARRQEADSLLEARREHLQRAMEVLRTEGREVERRIAALGAAIESVLEPAAGGSAEPAPTLEPVPAPRPEPVATPQPVPETAPSAEPSVPVALPEPQPEAQPARGGSGPHERQRALIRATQLAVQGADRDEVLATIEREFELDDSAVIVDEILGSG